MPRPPKFPRWADQPAAVVVEPTEPQKDAGWVAGQRPPAPFFNWLGKLGFDWFVWLDAEATRVSNLLATEVPRLDGKIDGVAAGINATVNGAVAALKAAQNTWDQLQTFSAGISTLGRLSLGANADIYRRLATNGAGRHLVAMLESTPDGFGFHGLGGQARIYLAFGVQGTDGPSLELTAGAEWDGVQWKLRQNAQATGYAGAVLGLNGNGMYRGKFGSVSQNVIAEFPINYL